MHLNRFAISAGVLIAGIAASRAIAQGPLYDKVIVDLPYSVSLNETTLLPGHYVIRQLDSPGGGSRILQIFTDNGMKLKTTAMTIPALDNNTPSKTSVILHHYGKDYYFDKVWIQGKNYGYEFPLPAAVKSRQRERMEPYTVAATYEPTSVATDESSVTSSSTTNTTQNTTQTTPAPAASTSTDTSDRSTNTTIAQNRPPATDTSNSSSTVSDQTGSTDNSRSGRRRMPKTGGDWFTMLLSGGMLSSAGLLLRRSARSTR